MCNDCVNSVDEKIMEQVRKMIYEGIYPSSGISRKLKVPLSVIEAEVPAVLELRKARCRSVRLKIQSLVKFLRRDDIFNVLPAIACRVNWCIHSAQHTIYCFDSSYRRINVLSLKNEPDVLLSFAYEIADLADKPDFIMISCMYDIIERIRTRITAKE